MKSSVITLSFFAAILCGCTHTSSDNTHSPLPLTVSIEPQRQILEAIGGHRVTVHSLLANGEDPETYDPTIGTLIHLDKSAGWFQVGNMPFENELVKKLSSGINCIDTSEGIELIEGTHGHSHDHSEESEDHGHHHHHGHSHDGVDPHTWSSVKNMRIIASNMYEALIGMDPEGKDYYRVRFDSVMSHLDSLDRVYEKRLAPLSGKTFMVWHPSLSYFARDYGLRQISVAADHRETSLLSLQSTIDKAINEGVEVFFEQSSYDPRLSATVQQHIGTVCVKFDPLDYDWETGLDRVVSALSSGH